MTAQTIEEAMAATHPVAPDEVTDPRTGEHMSPTRSEDEPTPEPSLDTLAARMFRH